MTYTLSPIEDRGIARCYAPSLFNTLLYCMYCIVLLPECTATFLRSIVNMLIKFCSEAFFLRLEVLQRACNLRLGTPRGLVLRIFTSLKYSMTSAGFEPANLGSRGKHVTPRPTTVLVTIHIGTGELTKQ